MDPFTAATPYWGWRSFSRSYGANLPSSLTAIHSRALVYSTFLPVSVYGTVSYIRYFLAVAILSS